MYTHVYVCTRVHARWCNSSSLPTYCCLSLLTSYMYVRTCVHVYIHTCVSVHTCICLHVCACKVGRLIDLFNILLPLSCEGIYVCTHMYVHTCMYTMYVCTHIYCMYAHMTRVCLKSEATHRLLYIIAVSLPMIYTYVHTCLYVLHTLVYMYTHVYTCVYTFGVNKM